MKQPRNLTEMDLNDLIPPLPFPNAENGSQQSYLGTPPQSHSGHGSQFGYTGMTQHGGSTHHPGTAHHDGMIHRNAGCSQNDAYSQIDATGPHHSGITQQVAMTQHPGVTQRQVIPCQANGYMLGQAPPAQISPPATGVTRVYYENPTTDSQLAAAGGSMYNPNAPPGSAPVPGVVRVIHLDYVVYNPSVTNQISQVQPSGSKGSKSGTAAADREWVCFTPKSENIWKTELESWSWPNAQAVIITLLGQYRELIGKHLTALHKEGLLKWQCILHNHGTYGVGSKYYVYSDEDFHPFVETMLTKPKSRVTIKIVMDDPRRSAKEKITEQTENDSLAMSYADDDDRLALQRVQARLVLNPKADLGSGVRTQHVAEITQHILLTYGGDTESLRIKDPQAPGRSIHITRECLYIWARALIAEAKDATSPAVKFTAPRRSASGRIRPPRIDLSGGPEVDLLESPEELLAASTPATSKASGVALTKDQLTTPIDQQRRGYARRESIASHESSVVSFAANIPEVSIPKGHTPSELSAGPASDVEYTRVESTDGTDIECVSGGAKAPDCTRSPARKIPRSPARGQGIAHTISRLDYNRHRSPLAGRVPSPTRKVPSSHRSASLLSEYQVGSGGRVDLPALNAAGRALTIKGFLDFCNFEKDDPVPRFLIKLTHIRHWDFFYRDTNVAQLQGMGFPYPIATQLMNGAKGLEKTHTEEAGLVMETQVPVSETEDEDEDRNPYPPSPEF
ncbi:hypothetical protein PGTUg99_013548 [Puccinia graminis f. sp. tritici]|uniref:Uncharacterized protein n=1 Tax=Puccinia graminis f. sp. tritici TaxID=56615 RepID=A0A5B0MC76_PUCGR|nr:hypothetical protein PGTUg99_013548 [Puccinia graminis f. sp. tritici]